LFRIFFLLLLFTLFAACSSPYSLTDRSGNTFIIEKPELEPKEYFEYRAGDATRELKPKDIVSLSIPNAEPTIFDGKVFYPATLALEDTVSVPPQGFICVEGTLKAENAGRKFSIKVMNISEIKLKKEEKEESN
jgi:hypothetical protein